MPPSVDHKRLQKRALVWAARRATMRGARGGVEVGLRPGYIADAVSVMGFNRDARRKYEGRTEPYNHPSVLIFECKVSGPDFHRTFSPLSRGRERPAGNLHWIVAPRGMIVSAHVPTFWGLLEVYSGGLTETVVPQFLHVDDDTYLAAVDALLWNSGTRNFQSELWRAVHAHRCPVCDFQPPPPPRAQPHP